MTWLFDHPYMIAIISGLIGLPTFFHEPVIRPWLRKNVFKSRKAPLSDTREELRSHYQMLLAEDERLGELRRGLTVDERAFFIEHGALWVEPIDPMLKEVEWTRQLMMSMEAATLINHVNEKVVS